MKRQTNDTANNITARTNIRLPIGFIAGIVAGAAVFLYAEIRLVHADAETKFARANNRIDTKASIEASRDRYTKTEARQHTESVKQRLLDVEKSNNTTHGSFQRQLDSHSRDIISLQSEIE